MAQENERGEAPGAVGTAGARPAIPRTRVDHALDPGYVVVQIRRNVHGRALPTSTT